MLNIALPPVPQWPLQEPGNPEAIEILMNSYFESNYNIGAMLETLFNSDFFKDESAHFARVTSPVELVVGTLRQAGGFDGPTYDVYASAAACGFMGQALLNPPPSLAQPQRYRRGGYIKKLPDDPWGRAYVYTVPGRRGAFDISSLGADGQPGGEQENADIYSSEL